VAIKLVDHMDQVLRQALALDSPDDFLKKPVPVAEPVPAPGFDVPPVETDVVTH
jgi:hypothetical protein